jgi:hypothetical protein
VLVHDNEIAFKEVTKDYANNFIRLFGGRTATICFNNHYWVQTLCHSDCGYTVIAIQID